MPSSFRSACAERLRSLLPARWRASHPLVAVVRLSGVIGAILPFRQGLSIATLAPTLERAFALRGLKAVALVVNSPGGSAVQSHLIFARIRALAEEKKVPVFAFIEDAGASGGYMLACAGDEIFADPSSVVGSIGVVSAGFGLDRFIERFGIERRLHARGSQKAMLDPFRPERPEDVERLKTIQERIHETFIALVEGRRGSRLKGERESLYSGAVWAGAEALDLGLVDGIGDLRDRHAGALRREGPAKAGRGRAGRAARAPDRPARADHRGGPARSRRSYRCGRGACGLGAARAVRSLVRGGLGGAGTAGAFAIAGIDDLHLAGAGRLRGRGPIATAFTTKAGAARALAPAGAEQASWPAPREASRARTGGRSSQGPCDSLGPCGSLEALPPEPVSLRRACGRSGALRPPRRVPPHLPELLLSWPENARRRTPFPTLRQQSHQAAAF